MGKKSIVITLVLLTSCSFLLLSCYTVDGLKIDLHEKMILTDTTIYLGNNLNLDLRKYYELIENGEIENFSGYPDIIPNVVDTSIAQINYDFEKCKHGEIFSIKSIRLGSTNVMLHLEWDDCDNTIRSYTDKNFIINVVEM